MGQALKILEFVARSAWVILPVFLSSVAGTLEGRGGDARRSPARGPQGALPYRVRGTRAYGKTGSVSASRQPSLGCSARTKLRTLPLECCHVELERRGRVVNYYQRDRGTQRPASGPALRPRRRDRTLQPPDLEVDHQIPQPTI